MGGEVVTKTDEEQNKEIEELRAKLDAACKAQAKAVAKEELKVNAIALGLMVLAAYVIYIAGNIYCYKTMPDGPLFGGLLTVLGLVFGVKLGPAIVALYNKEAK